MPPLAWPAVAQRAVSSNGARKPPLRAPPALWPGAASVVMFNAGPATGQRLTAGGKSHLLLTVVPLCRTLCGAPALVATQAAGPE